MQLNHLDLSVPDVAAEAAFFEQQFGFRELQRKGNAGMAVLQGAGGFVLVLTRSAVPVEQAYPKTFHIGFLLPDEASVRAAHTRIERARAGSCSPVSEQRGSLLFYCRTPGGVLVEVGYRPDAVTPASGSPAP
jgi:catechol 2,3-dioxygenase-like lactoylglutathione lyase family enzyme